MYNDGLIDINEFADKIRDDTILVSVIFVNNETGVIQPIEEIGDICKRHIVFFLTDATQAVGKTPIDVNKLNVDLLCFAGHKFYGPKGIGGLYCRKDVNIEPLIHGWGHERGLRSGALNVTGIVGLAKAFEIAHSEMSPTQEKIKTLRNKFENNLLETKIIKINGHPTQRLFNVSNICITNMDPFLIQNELSNVAYSRGSACNSSSVKPSYVLKAMGYLDKEVSESFRFSFGKYNTMAEINVVIEKLKKLFETKSLLNKV